MFTFAYIWSILFIIHIHGYDLRSCAYSVFFFIFTIGFLTFFHLSFNIYLDGVGTKKGGFYKWWLMSLYQFTKIYLNSDLKMKL